MTTTSIPAALTVAEAAAKVGVSASTIRREIAAGRLTSRRIGRCLRILDTELGRWLNDYEANGRRS